jgi:hypothetical protein
MYSIVYSVASNKNELPVGFGRGGASTHHSRLIAEVHNMLVLAKIAASHHHRKLSRAPIMI